MTARPIALRTAFEAAAATYDSAAVLARETGARMDERLSLTKIQPRRIADIGCATGDGIRALQIRYPAAQAVAIDYAMPMLRTVGARSGRIARLMRKTPQLVCADAAALPLATESVGLVWSNLMLHWLDDPLPALRELHRVLEVGGLVMFTMLGPDTLKEIRAAASSVGADDTPIRTHAEGADTFPHPQGEGSWERVGDECNTSPSTIRNFIDMHDIGDMLMAAGFSDPVMDMEVITMTYTHPRKFLADQRQLGVRNDLLGQQTWQAWRKTFGGWQANAEGNFPASFEIVYGHAWKPAARQAKGEHSVIHFHRRDSIKI